jgi:Zn-dependent protease
MEGLPAFTETPARIAVAVSLMLLAVSAHEAGHAWAADRCGDPTARKAGRVSLLPFTHIDPVGSLLLPALLALVKAPFIIGYARPTPVDPARLRRPKPDFSLVAAAGPAANLAMALAFSLLGGFLFRGLGFESAELGLLLGGAIAVNAWLACLNLLPLPGFDGLKALYAFLPDEWCWRLQAGERYFLVVLVLATWLGALNIALLPGLWLSRWLCAAAGVGLPSF